MSAKEAFLFTAVFFFPARFDLVESLVDDGSGDAEFVDLLLGLKFFDSIVIAQRFEAGLARLRHGLTAVENIGRDCTGAARPALRPASQRHHRGRNIGRDCTGAVRPALRPASPRPHRGLTAVETVAGTVRERWALL